MIYLNFFYHVSLLVSLFESDCFNMQSAGEKSGGKEIRLSH